MKKRAYFLMIYILTLLLFPLVSFAQAPSALTLTPPDSDLSVGYLSNIFGVVDGVLAGTGSQLLGAMFSIFNGAVLVLGGIVILYTLFVSTINTAGEGEMLGKRWSSIWIPLRSVVGIALLIPKASGYSFIQIFMMWVIVQGVGAADSVWNAALDYFLSGGVLIQQNTTPGSAGGSGGALMTPAATLLRSLTCMEGLQQELKDYQQAQISSGQPNPISQIPDFLQQVNAAITNNLNTTGSVTIQFPPTSTALYNAGVCGSITWSNVTSSTADNASGASLAAKQKIMQSRGLAIASMVQQLGGSAQAIVGNYYTSLGGTQMPLGYLISTSPTNIWGAGTLSSPKAYLLPGNTVSNAVGTYYGVMAPTLNLINSSGNVAKVTSWVADAKQWGWVLAGRFYFDVIKLNSSMNLSESSPPTMTPPSTDFQTQPVQIQLPDSYLLELNQLINNPTVAFGVGQGSAGTFIADSITYGNSLAYGNVQAPGGGGANVDAGRDEINSLLAPVLGVGSYIKTGMMNLAQSQQSNTNPVVAIAQLGNGLVGTIFWTYIGVAIAVLVIGLGLGLAFGFAMAAAVAGLAVVIMGLLSPILIPLFVIGLTMTFYIPMIPFIIFLFGAIGWFISVVEAIIAAPLVALGIAHPEGQEILGKAEPAVVLLVNVFLRPTFMIFGLLIGMMLSYVGIWLLNEGFYNAFTDATSVSGQSDVVSGLFAPCAYLIIYVLIAQQVVQKSFTLIHVIPDEVLKWIGGNIKGMGGEAEAEGKISSGFGGAAGAMAQTTEKGAMAAMNATKDAFSMKPPEAPPAEGSPGLEADAGADKGSGASQDKGGDTTSGDAGGGAASGAGAGAAPVVGAGGGGGGAVVGGGGAAVPPVV